MTDREMPLTTEFLADLSDRLSKPCKWCNDMPGSGLVLCEFCENRKIQLRLIRRMRKMQSERDNLLSAIEEYLAQPCSATRRKVKNAMADQTCF